MVKYLEDHNRAGEVETFKKNINGVMKNLLGKFKDLQFYQGESMDPHAMIILLDYKEVRSVKNLQVLLLVDSLCLISWFFCSINSTLSLHSISSSVVDPDPNLLAGSEKNAQIKTIKILFQKKP